MVRATGLTVREWRRLRGLSVEELAAKLGCSTSQLHKIEAPNCNQTVGAETLAKLDRLSKGAIDIGALLHRGRADDGKLLAS